MGNDEYLAKARDAIRRMEQSLAQADAAGEWSEVAQSVTRGLEGFVDLLCQHRDLTPGQRARLLRWLQVQYLHAVAALDPSVAQSLKTFLRSRGRTMEQALMAAASLQIKFHVRTRCDQALRDPAQVMDGVPGDVGHVGRILEEVADLCRRRLAQWDSQGQELDALPAELFTVLGKDFSLVED